MQAEIDRSVGVNPRTGLDKDGLPRPEVPDEQVARAVEQEKPMAGCRQLRKVEVGADRVLVLRVVTFLDLKPNRRVQPCEIDVVSRRQERVLADEEATALPGLAGPPPPRGGPPRAQRGPGPLPASAPSASRRTSG